MNGDASNVSKFSQEKLEWLARFAHTLGVYVEPTSQPATDWQTEQNPFESNGFDDDEGVVCDYDVDDSKEARVNAFGSELGRAPPELRKDEDVVLAAVRCYGGNVLKWADESLRADNDFMLKCVEISGPGRRDMWENGPLKFAAEQLMNDKKFVLSAARIDASALINASPDCMADCEIAIAAASAPHGPDGHMWPTISHHHWKNREVVLAWVRRNAWDVLVWDQSRVPSSIKDDREIMIAAVQQNRDCWPYLPEWCGADRKVVLASLSQQVDESGSVASSMSVGEMFTEHVSETLRAEMSIAIAAVQVDGCALGAMSDTLRAERQLVIQAVQQDGQAFKFASEELHIDPEIVLLSKIVSALSESSLELSVGRIVGSDENVRAVFRSIDNGTAQVSQERFVQAASKLKASIPREKLCELFVHIDANSDGVLDEEEFVAWLYQGADLEDDEFEGSCDEDE